MKRNNLIACLGAAFGLVFGAAAFSYSNDQGAVEAKAESTVTLYCKMTYSWWTQDNAAIGVFPTRDIDYPMGAGKIMELKRKSFPFLKERHKITALSPRFGRATA